MNSIQHLKLRKQGGAGFLKSVGKFARPFLMNLAHNAGPFVTSQLKEIGKKAIKDGGDLLTHVIIGKGLGGRPQGRPRKNMIGGNRPRGRPPKNKKGGKRRGRPPKSKPRGRPPKSKQRGRPRKSKAGGRPRKSIKKVKGGKHAISTKTGGKKNTGSKKPKFSIFQ